MIIRTLIFILLVPAAVRSAAAQPLEIRDHPGASTTVLWSAPATQDGIYLHERGLVFSSRAGIRNVDLDGTLMAAEVSPSGSRVGVLLKTAASGALQVRVFSRDGSAELTRELAFDQDDPLPQIALSDRSGEVVYARPATAEVCFLTIEIRDCSALFKDAVYTHERNVFLEVSPDGGHVAVAAQRNAVHPGVSEPNAVQPGLSEPNAYLFLFDRDGTMIWRRPLPNPAVRSLGFSSRIAVSTYSVGEEAEIVQHSRLVDVDGATIADAPFGADAFAFGEKEILLITAREVAAFDDRNGTSHLVFRSDSGRRILSASADADITLLTGVRTFAGDGFVYENLRLLRLDEDGALVGVEDVSAPPQRAPRVESHARGGVTALILDRETRLYSSLPR